MKHVSASLVVAALVATALFPACGKTKKPATTPTTESTQPARPGVKPLTEGQKAAIKAAFDEAGKVAAQAHEHLLAAQKIEGESSIQDAYDEYRAAKHGYRDAMEAVEPWLQEDFGKLTRDQIDAFMKPYQGDVVAWQKAMRLLPKVPPKE